MSYVVVPSKVLGIDRRKRVRNDCVDDNLENSTHQNFCFLKFIASIAVTYLPFASATSVLSLISERQLRSYFAFES